MMWVTRSRRSSAHNRSRSDRSSTTCVVAPGTGSSPMARYPAAERRDITARPTKPLEPVTSVRVELMGPLSGNFGRGRDSQRALDEPARPNCGIDRLAVSQHKTTSNDRVKHPAGERAAFVDGEAGAGADVFPVVGILRTEIDDREVGIETNRDAPLAMMQSHRVGGLARQQLHDSDRQS